MRRKIMFLLMVAVLTVFTASVALAAGTCPPGFTLEEMMHHEHHAHMHVGISADINGDGYICMKPVTPGSHIHVHVDNNLP